MNNVKFNFPARIEISGSSGSGKTTMAFNLVKKQHFTKQIKNLYYFSCNGKGNLDWHNQLQDVNVNYMDGMPSSDFFENIPSNSIGKYI